MKEGTIHHRIEYFHVLPDLRASATSAEKLRNHKVDGNLSIQHGQSTRDWRMWREPLLTPRQQSPRGQKFLWKMGHDFC
jgi:hypothetical protein